MRYIGYVMPSAHGPCFVVRSSEKKSERGSDFLIGAKVSAHEPIFNATLVDVYDRLFMKLMPQRKLCVIYKYGNITYKTR